MRPNVPEGKEWLQITITGCGGQGSVRVAYKGETVFDSECSESEFVSEQSRDPHNKSD
jgi:hypothetical protein